MAQSAHQHGVADLLVAVEAGTVVVELVSPAANLLGFEHTPRSEAQWQSAMALIETLKSKDPIQTLHSAGACRTASWYWETELFDAEGLTTRRINHGSDNGHQEEVHRSHTGHAEFTVGYTFDCPDTPAAMEHKLFQLFEGLDELRVSVVTDEGQRGTRQHRGQPLRMDL